ncbi:type III secretion system export apparatus subunit SctV [Devosia sp. ZB163]|uniref:type III secretion system export apparatus subunit SctV n=1 Tax=Devosia sp. ZB163 TaxID=3025938 RepID=UPI002362D074|nr:type III secretion system export apparatus subunit SctV [Devosia sp. ZB163]MDC9823028.1 type III secretion system export apparatus subunit SctV [Devosia sp. ZB163]
MQRFLVALSKRTDLLLAVLLISIIFMMILPLPTELVDVLIAINLALTVILLMAAVYLTDVTQLSAFPSILLLTTLFRLGLAITTTRLILIQGDAGHIVQTFGEFVVGGNLVVGLVVFLILTIVNFMVITKGSERVAEVSARFSLDSMPGKQMSIDSDMRAGMIELDEAKRRRSKLEQESQLFGAMDGAMKFVKGDAIAGIIIIAVNLIGGVSIGMFQRGLEAGEALNLYALLTIGDGLIQQIPALFVSITAGFIVTRVANEDSKDLGSDIAKQLLNQPNALKVTGAILLIFALVPGFPWPVFLVLAIIAGGGGFLMARRQTRATQTRRSAEMPALTSALTPEAAPQKFPDDDEDTGPVENVTFALTVPLIVDIAASVRSSIRPEKLDREVARVRRALYFDLGVPFPGIHLRLNENLKDGEYRILVNEIPVAAGQARPGFVMVRETEANLNMFNIPFERGADFLPHTPSLWVSVKHLPMLERAGMQVMTLSSMLTFHLAHMLKANAAEFIGVQETMFLMNQMQKNFAELVREATRILPATAITDVLQRLVSEEISIRDMRTVLEALVTWGQREKDPIVLAEHVRGALGRYITHKFSGGQNIIPAYLLSKDIEDAVRGAVRQTSGASYLALSPDVHREMIASIKDAVGTTERAGVSPVVLAPMDIRRFMRKIIERDFPSLAVLSYQELTPSANIQPLERIRMNRQGQLSAAE